MPCLHVAGKLNGISAAVNRVAQAGDPGHGGGKKEGIDAPILKGKGADQTSEDESCQKNNIQGYLTSRDGVSSEKMAYGQSQISDDASDMGGADNGSAIGGSHGVLEAAGKRGCIVAIVASLPKCERGDEEKKGFDE